MDFCLDMSKVMQDSFPPLSNQLRTRSSSKMKISPCRENSKDSFLLLCLSVDYLFAAVVVSRQNVIQYSHKKINSEAVHIKII